MAAYLKQTTNLKGLPVAVGPKNILNRIYKKILLITEKMPQNSAYRKHTEEVVNFRKTIINSTDDVKIMEEKINCGQIEEVIIQAKKELALAEKFLFMKPWEPLTTPVPRNQWKWPVK